MISSHSLFSLFIHVHLVPFHLTLTDSCSSIHHPDDDTKLAV
ncbi:hypothetical protein M8C21_010898 [Ambrosia artemisiifolia]|uniref:Uncharacterized protein n=1 Tax=Ambrosia artemisiifolia TaxID=4212 RepID=A0AAD5GYC7_AMBAR|nr:hypothetical protein M8C21_010898 [Ambrosia artemisiifolia]